jgi:hypothetical protein
VSLGLAVALSFVVWPSPRLAAVSPEGRRVYSEETRRRTLELVERLVYRSRPSASQLRILPA